MSVGPLRAGLADAPSTGSSNRVTRAHLLDAPLSMEGGEITSEGSIDQRAVLRNTADLVEELYGEPASGRLILVDAKKPAPSPGIPSERTRS